MTSERERYRKSVMSRKKDIAKKKRRQGVKNSDDDERER